MKPETRDYPVVRATRQSGHEKFSLNGRALEIDVLSFWQWFGSDLLSNTARGVLAEYIVANALGIADSLRLEWNAFDLLTRDGIKVEVKSAAYIQSWFQKKHSAITFGIQPARAWDSETNILGTELKRQADIYVFSILAHKEQETIDPLNLDQWEFYVLPTSVLNNACPVQKKISLSRVIGLGAIKTDYLGLSEAIRGS